MKGQNQQLHRDMVQGKATGRSSLLGGYSRAYGPMASWTERISERIKDKRKVRPAADCSTWGSVGSHSRAPGDFHLPDMKGLPPLTATIPVLPSLASRRLASSSVFDLAEREQLDRIAAKIISDLKS